MSENHINEELNEELKEEESVKTEEVGGEKSEIETLKDELQKEKDQFLRLFDEFENYKKRTTKERLEICKTANSETITALQIVLDDFERAIKEIEKSDESKNMK